MGSSSCVLTESHRLAVPERVITELTRGREIADRIRLMLRETGFDGPGGSAFPVQSLVSQLLDSFNHSLTMLRDGGESDEVSQAPSAAKSEDSGDSCKTPATKDRRGCYKRKRNWETTIKESSHLSEDGHAWRKYGQKAILNAKHPRNYFRCTHKFDQGCQASKQVQKISDDPPVYRTTYNGHHTCNKSTSAHHHLLADFPAPDSSVIWSFSNTDLAMDSALIKQEETNNKEYYTAPPELEGFEAFSGGGSDHGASDVYSCSASTHDSMQDVDDIVGSIEDFFEFGSLS